jgi:arsenate reductase-like glutaredoxin family protein
MSESVAVTIYHNQSCGTSRNVLALIRNAGVHLHGNRIPQDSPGSVHT